jgi:septal ring factor EnvC (AmiA/AmiB activator)
LSLASLANAFAAFFFLVAIPMAAQAQNGAGKGDADTSVLSLDGEVIDLDEARRLFKQHQDELDRIEREQLGLKTQSDTLNTETAQLQQNLIDSARKIKNAEKKLTRSEGEIAELAEQQKQLEVALVKNRTAIAQMLGVMQKMGREPPPVMMTERNDALRMVRSAMILASFFPGFREKAEELSTTIADLNSIITKSREEHKILATAQTEFAAFKNEVESLLKQKRETMQANWQEQEKLRIAASRHSRAVSDFGDLLTRLDAEVAKQSTLKEYEEELRALGPAIEVKPTVQEAAFVSPGRMKPSVPFEKAKGLLPFPASGQRLISFGADDEVGGKSQGIRVETRSEAQITSPSDGWVIYAGKFRSYGQLLIINAGGGYHILLAGLGQIYTEVGQFVLAGEPVATMGESPQLAQGSVQARSPVLYIEFRKNARPVDPDPWWSEGVKEG